MPIHDWSRVFDGAFHDLHLAWIAELRSALNGGILPPQYYALAKQVARPMIPDVLTLQTTNGSDKEWSGEPISGASTVALAPPKVLLTTMIEEEVFAQRQKSIIIRHSSDDRIIALIEILSRSNKSSNLELRTLVAKAANALEHGHHLMLIDLQPPTSRDPGGIHPLIWDDLGGMPEPIPAVKPLTLVAYDAGPPKTAYVEPVAVGDVLKDMPLFLAHRMVCFTAAGGDVSRRVARRAAPVSGCAGVRQSGSVISAAKISLTDSRCLNPLGVAELEVVDCLVAQHVLADLPRDGPG